MVKIIKIKDLGKDFILKLPTDVPEFRVELGVGAVVTILGVKSGQKVDCVLEERAKLTFLQCYFGEDFEGDVSIKLKGRESVVFSKIIFLGKDINYQSIKFKHQHFGVETKSKLVIRGVLLDKAQGFINGTIRMEPKCLGADGRLEEKILLLSPTARIEAEPNLEIRCHEVMASHAASVERIDEEKLFYLASRGIAGEVAIPLIVEGFLGEALGDLVDQSLKKRMNEIVFKGGVVN